MPVLAYFLKGSYKTGYINCMDAISGLWSTYYCLQSRGCMSYIDIYLTVQCLCLQRTLKQTLLLAGCIQINKHLKSRERCHNHGPLCPSHVIFCVSVTVCPSVCCNIQCKIHIKIPSCFISKYKLQTLSQYAGFSTYREKIFDLLKLSYAINFLYRNIFRYQKLFNVFIMF